MKSLNSSDSKKGALTAHSKPSSDATVRHAAGLSSIHAAGNRAVIQQMNRNAASETSRPAGTGRRTGLPDKLKTGIESLSGIDMSDVNVHQKKNLGNFLRFFHIAYVQTQ